MSDRPIHPLAAKMPGMSRDEYSELVASIDGEGQFFPVILDQQGRVIDGIHRMQACEELGIQPRFETRTFADEAECAQFIWDTNLARRHIPAGRRAALCLLLYDDLEELRAQARDRQATAGRGANVGTSSKTRDHIARRSKSSATTAAKAMAVADRNPELLAKVAMPGGPSLNSAYQRVMNAEVREKIEAGQCPLPQGKYGCIAADVPWKYNVVYPGHRGSISYPPMELEDICALPIAERAAEDCVLAFWTTNHFILRETAQVLDAWGFEPKTVITWVKPKIGAGNWARGQTEHFVIAIRGKPQVDASAMPTVLQAPVREHSRKPDEFYERMERYCLGPRLELFAREARDGWTAWGAETDKFAPMETL